MIKSSYISINYQPLHPSMGIAPDGGVTDSQSYDAGPGTWTPDYRITPLVLRPSVRVIDPAGDVTGDVTAKLADVQWFEVTSGGTETLITGSEPSPHDSTKKKYTLGTAADGWTLQVNANINAPGALSLRFKAKYLDTRTNAVYTVMLDHVVRCTNATLTVPQLVIDFAEVSTWDPIYESVAAIVKLKAMLTLPSGEVDQAKRTFVWEMLREDGTWSEVGQSILDNECTISADTSELTLDRSLMGTRIDLRCRAKYDPDGNPAAVTLTDLSPERRVSCVRELCYFDYDNTTPRRLAPGSKKMRLSCRIHGDRGDLPDPERELSIVWYSATNVTNPSYKEIARGMNPTVSASQVGDAGLMTGVEVTDRGPLKYLMVDGAYLTVGGKLLMARAK